VSVELVRRAWVALGDGREAENYWDASPGVSSNRVYRVQLSDGSSVFAKVISYGSFIHFRQDHQRIAQWKNLLAGSQFDDFLAPILSKDGEPFVYRSNRDWLVFCEEVEPGESLPKRLSAGQVRSLGHALAEFHQESQVAAESLDSTWKTMGSDVAALFDRVTDPEWRSARNFTRNQVAMIERHCETFFRNAERIGYHRMKKIPVLVDWNITNFSTETASGDQRGDDFRFFRRWDYDWFRIEPRTLDFYFMSRVVRDEGDTSRFSYTADMLLEPRFRLFLEAYHERNPLENSDILFLKETYRFFILNYVLHLGEHFFQWSLCKRLQHEAVETYLPGIDGMDLAPLLEIVR
jgi:hypothetical protein